MSDYPFLGGIALGGKQVAGVYHAGKRVGLAHGDRLLVPSGKNLLRYGAGAGDKWAVEIAPDGGLTVTLDKSFKAWNSITFEVTLADAGLESGDAIVVSCDELAGCVCISTRFMDGGNLIDESDYLTSRAHVVKTNIPAGTKYIQTQVFTNAALADGIMLHLHPQLEKGSARTCWEPPENLRGGGQSKRP